MRSIPARAPRARRIAVNAAVATTLLLMASPALLAQGTSGGAAAASQDRRPTLFVVDFRVSAIGQQNDYAPLGSGIADLLVSDLAQNPGIRVVDRENLRRVLEEQDLSSSNRIDDATAVKAGRILGAHHFIKGSIMVDPRGRVRLDAHAVSTETTGIEHVETVTGSGDDVMDLIAQLSEKLNKGLDLPDLPPVAARPAAGGADAADAAGGAPAGAGSSSATTTSAAGATNDPATPSSPSGPVSQPKKPSSAQKKPNLQAVMLYSRALAEEDKGNRAAAVELYRKTLADFPDYDKAKARLAKLERSGN